MEDLKAEITKPHLRSLTWAAPWVVARTGTVSEGLMCIL